jgi:hypothetical protein
VPTRPTRSLPENVPSNPRALRLGGCRNLKFAGLTQNLGQLRPL